MPTIQTQVGEAIVYDGSNAAELAEAVGAETVPIPDENRAIVLAVRLPTGELVEVPFTLGGGLVVRQLGFLPISEEQIAMLTPKEA